MLVFTPKTVLSLAAAGPRAFILIIHLDSVRQWQKVWCLLVSCLYFSSTGDWKHERPMMTWSLQVWVKIWLGSQTLALQNKTLVLFQWVIFPVNNFLSWFSALASVSQVSSAVVPEVATVGNCIMVRKGCLFPFHSDLSCFWELIYPVGSVSGKPGDQRKAWLQSTIQQLQLTEEAL